MSKVVTITVLNGPLAGDARAVSTPGRVVVGRLPDCQIQLPADSPGVSRQHLAIDVDPPAAHATDLGSTNGTWINQVRLSAREDSAPTRIELADGDRIGIGETVLHVALSAPSGVSRAVRCLHCGRAERLAVPPPVSFVCGDCQSTMRDAPADVLRRLREEVPDGASDFAGYRIERELGRGGMGRVYLAIREDTGDHVALKVQLSHIQIDEKARAEFLREMEVAGRLRHPNLVPCLAEGASGNAFWFAMEFCPGGSLTDLMQRKVGRLDPSEAVPLMCQALEGLGHMHRHGYVHRDLKPQNILLSAVEGGVARVADFGLAKSFERAGLTGMTATGAVRGTPHFTPREQVTNYKYVKPVSDVWAMGATLYHVLTGTFPRTIRSGANPMLVALTGELVPVRARDEGISETLAGVIDHALEIDPALRYPDADALREALLRV